MKANKVLVIGAGLAGSEAAYFLAEKGIQVVLLEVKNKERNPAQKSVFFAELVCTNSLKSTSSASAHGMLKYEMNALGSLILKVANSCKVPAGEALAVDREKFSEEVTKVLRSHPNITVIEEEGIDPIDQATSYECNYTIVATGPLTSSKLENWLCQNIGKEDLYFYDAIAPVVDGDSLDYTKLYFKDRYADERALRANVEAPEGDYLNIPFNKEEYLHFITELKNAEKVPAKNFEQLQFFESCLPIDLMAERGEQTARFACMRPVGLHDKNGKRPYAVMQLRKENLLGNAFNLVGCQTRLTYKEQLRVFRLVPGLENAIFLHLGSVHRNTFLNTKRILNFSMASKEFPRLYFAGQMTGVEGYTESSAMGLYVAWQIFRQINGQQPVAWPVETCLGALVNYLLTCERPAPSNINRGLFPALPISDLPTGKKKMPKDLKAVKLAERAKKYVDEFLNVHDLRIM